MKKVILFVVILIGLAILGIGLYDYFESKEPAENPIVDETPAVEILWLSIPHTASAYDPIRIEYEEGMTWAEWCDSEYNDLSATVTTSVVLIIPGHFLKVNNEDVSPTDVIDSSLGYVFN